MCEWVFVGTHLRATERHLPYELTQCYLPADSRELAPCQEDLLSIDFLPTADFMPTNFLLV